MNKTADEVAEAAKSDDGKETLLNLHKERIKELKKTNFDDGFKKAEKKVKSDFEKELREKFGVDSDKQGLELIEEVITSKLPKPGEKAETPKELTEDDVKVHPLFLAKEKEVDSLKATAETLKGQIEEVKTNTRTQLQQEWERERIFNEATESLFGANMKLNPITSADPVKAKSQYERTVIARLKEEGIQFEKADGQLIPVKDGKRLEDEHGRALRIEDLNGKYAPTFYDYKVAEDRSSPGAGTQPVSTPAKAKYEGEVPANALAYASKMNELKNAGKADQLPLLKEAYQASQK